MSDRQLSIDVVLYFGFLANNSWLNAYSSSAFFSFNFYPYSRSLF